MYTVQGYWGKSPTQNPRNMVDSMVVEMVPLKGGIGSIFHPPLRQGL